MTTAHLLDVNFLVALAWPNHLSHAVAREWFVHRDAVPFATCPITEAGFVRVSMNPLVVGSQISLSAALGVLQEYQRRFEHAFWADGLSVSEALGRLPGLVGHRQVTGGYLLALAAANGGTLVTLDAGLASLVREASPEHLLIVR